MKRTTVLFFLPNLGGGGAQKVVATLLRGMDYGQYTIHLALVEKKGNFLQDLPETVVIHDLGARKARQSPLAFYRITKALKPDIIFSTPGYINFIALILKVLFFRKTRLILREANTLSQKLADKDIKWPFVWRWLYKILYPRADLIVCQSMVMLRDLADNFAIPEDKLVCIYNPVDFDLIREKAAGGGNPYPTDRPGKNIVAAGRLTWQKGFDRLIESFAGLAAKNDDVRLWIIGKGDLLADLRARRDSLGLTERITFVGFQENIYPWLKNADLFVLSSCYEGLPNTLLEAIALECPVVSLQHPGGTGEIMRSIGIDDRFVKELSWEPGWYSRLTETQLANFKNTLDTRKIIDQYSHIFKSGSGQ